jgi:hypothetical protein
MQSHQITNLVMLYVVIMVVLYITKPSIMFDPQTGNMLQAGIGPNKTIVSFPVVAILLPVLLHFWNTHY